MLALIKREIRDNMTYFLLAVILSAVFAGNTISLAYSDVDGQFVAFVFILILAVIAAPGICTMGSSQMYIDKTKKISAFVSTLSTTRHRILTARLLAGLLVILILLVPVAVTAKIILRIKVVAEMPEFYDLVNLQLFNSVLQDMFVTALLTAFSIYCLGLQIGWVSSKGLQVFRIITLSFILTSLIIIKGPGLQVKVILALFIIASLIRIWNKFMTVPLV